MQGSARSSPRTSRRSSRCRATTSRVSRRCSVKRSPRSSDQMCRRITSVGPRGIAVTGRDRSQVLRAVAGFRGPRRCVDPRAAGGGERRARTHLTRSTVRQRSARNVAVTYGTAHAVFGHMIESQRATQTMTDRHGARVMIVEDDADIAMLVANVLAEEGYATDVITDSRQALETFERTGPAIVAPP